MDSQETDRAIEFLRDRLDRRLVQQWESDGLAEALLNHLRRRTAPRLPFSPDRLGQIAQLAIEHDPSEAAWERRIADEGVAGRLYAASNPYCDRFAEIDRGTFDFSKFEHEDPEALHGLNRLRTLAAMGRIYWENRDRRYFDALMDWWDFYDRVVPDPTEEQMRNVHGIGPITMAPPYGELDSFIRLINFWWAFWLSLWAEPMTAQRCAVLLARCLRLFDLVVGCGVRRHEHNFTSMQFEAVYHWAICLPEIPAMAAWKHAARNIMESSLERAVFEDGAQWEKSLGYHIGCIQWYGTSSHLGRRNGEPWAREYETRLRKMGDYADALVTPDGLCLLQSDTDRTSGWKSALALLRGMFDDIRFTHEARPTYGSLWRTDGKVWPAGQTVPPQVSRIFDRAGVAVARHAEGSGMLVLDNGPTAAGHAHKANLTLHYEALGKPILVDPGRWIYGRNPARQWVVSPEAHNTVVIEDRPCHAERGGGIEHASYQIIPVPGDSRLGEIRQALGDGLVKLASRFSGFVEDEQAWVERTAWMPTGAEEPFLVVCDRMAGQTAHRWTNAWLWPMEQPLQSIDGGFRAVTADGLHVALAAWDASETLALRDDLMFWCPSYAVKRPARWTRWSTTGRQMCRVFVLAVGRAPRPMPMIERRGETVRVRVGRRGIDLG